MLSDSDRTSSVRSSAFHSAVGANLKDEAKLVTGSHSSWFTRKMRPACSADDAVSLSPDSAAETARRNMGAAMAASQARLNALTSRLDTRKASTTAEASSGFKGT